MRIAAALAASLLLGSCTEPHEAIVRGTVARLGVEGAHAKLLRLAREGSGKDKYVFAYLLGMTLPPEPSHAFDHWPYHSLDDVNAFANCAASAGYEPALERLYGLLSQRADGATLRACIDNRRYGFFGLGADMGAWRTCGADKLLPACPLDKELAAK